MSKELTKKEQYAGVVYDLQVLLNSKPQIVRENKYAQNAQYIPISEIEGGLDILFGPMGWKVSGFQFRAIGGETGEKIKAYFQCDLELSVKHEGEWISRTGVASGAATANQITTFAAKLKAEAFKNAAKSFGVRFGRDLNRGETYTNHTQTEDKKLAFETVKKEFNECADPKTLYRVYIEHPYRHEAWVNKLFQDRKTELSKAK